LRLGIGVMPRQQLDMPFGTGAKLCARPPWLCARTNELFIW
jgi:hypothetical protein